VLREGVEAGVFNVPDVKVASYAILLMCTGVSSWFAEKGRLGGEEVRVSAHPGGRVCIEDDGEGLNGACPMDRLISRVMALLNDEQAQERIHTLRGRRRRGEADEAGILLDEIMISLTELRQRIVEAEEENLPAEYIRGLQERTEQMEANAEHILEREGDEEE